ncbi:hypothetical protein F4780DRAFT_780180 [Xylariomycetidae sp. FL0641]|nr:hypothetical protein F4780DRAFT_780180 [Xylariomycetidae sp. FL0641]
MDALAELALAVFEHCSIFERVSSTQEHCHLITVAESQCIRRDVPSEGRGLILQEAAKSADLALVMIPVGENEAPLIGKLAFKAVIDDMGIDPRVLGFIGRQYDGFHRFASAGSLTCVIGTAMYALAWTFDCGRRSTSAVYLERKMTYITGMFANAIEKHWRFVSSSALLAWVACLTTNDFVDSNMALRELHIIHELERFTNFGRDADFDPTQRFDVNQILMGLKMAADVHINIAHNMRLTRMVCLVTTSILNGFGADMDLPHETTSDIHESNRELRPAVSLLNSQASATEDYGYYLKERAGQLSNVLFALVTHEDAVVNAKLASVSSRIAVQTKHDSSSMKTIAVVTMVFLPATFFATLFDLPSLDWASAQVVQDSFWIYLAFTIPTTFLVIVAWFLLNRRAGIKKWILERKRKSQS